MAESLSTVDGAAAARTGAEAARAVLDRYLSHEHRDDPGHRCPLPATLGEGVLHQDEVPATAVAVGVEAMRDRLARLGCPQQDALALVALMISGQLLARTLRGTALSDEVLVPLAGARSCVVAAVSRIGYQMNAFPRTAVLGDDRRWSPAISPS